MERNSYGATMYPGELGELVLVVGAVGMLLLVALS